MFLSNISIERPVLATMLIMVFVVFGFLAYKGMNLEQMPEVEIPIVTIQTVYAGASPEIVESQITDKIEDAVSTVAGIDEITSYSIENFSLVIVQFVMSKDNQIGLQEIKDKVEPILNDLPDASDKPEIEIMDPFSDAEIEYVLTGDIAPVELYDLANNELKEQFSQIPGVAKVIVDGGSEREIQILFSQKTAISDGISLPAISQVLSAENLDMSGGSFENSQERLSSKLEGEYKSLSELEATRVPTAYGMRRIREIAEVVDTQKEQTIISSYHDNVDKIRYDNVIRLGLVISKDGNVVKVDEEADKRFAEIKEYLPAGTELSKVYSNAGFTRSAVEDTVSNILMGIFLTALILLFFLHDYRSTLIAAVSMPVSLISSFALMNQMGYTMNTITLMALSTSVGILVTNAVVVLENIFRHKNLGEGRRNSARLGTSEITIAVIASAMTNVAVFLPMASLSSMVGNVLRPFAMTVVFATLFSLLISFTLTPMLASRILPEKPRKNKLGSAIEGIFQKWEFSYKNTLKTLLSNRWYSAITVVLAMGLFVLSFQLAGKLGFEFMPQSDVGKLDIRLELPPGTDLATTEAKVIEIEDIITSHPEVKHILGKLGEIDMTVRGSNTAKLAIELIDADEREISSAELGKQLTQELSEVSNVQIKIAPGSMFSMGGDDVEFSLKGSDSAVLESISEEITERLAGVPGLTNYDTSAKKGNPQISFIPNRQKMAEYGVMMSDLAYALRSGVEGFIADTYYKENNLEYEIRISYADSEVNTPEEIGRIPVVTQRGVYSLTQFCEVQFTETSAQIRHEDKIKTIQFTGGLAEGYKLGDINKEVDKRLAELELPAGYTLSWGGFTDMMNENVQDMALVMLIAIILTYMLLAAILESFFQPFIILATLPMAMIGVFTALYITGLGINMISMLSIVMLIGIVVNNAILIMDYANQLIRKRDYSVKEALLEAAPTKLKPVLMTTLSIILGMLPMALGMGESAREMRQPMGVVSIGGLLASAVLTLYVIPAIFLLTTKSNIK
jgi:hydrophobic/amphiphilic exporter-1 (mainly G- bacteria), HAE1 family